MEWEKTRRQFTDHYKNECEMRDVSQEEMDVEWALLITQDEEMEKKNHENRESYANLLLEEMYRPHIRFCVLDDLSSSPEAMKSRLLKKYIDNGRQYLLFLIIGAQDARDIPTGKTRYRCMIHSVLF